MKPTPTKSTQTPAVELPENNHVESWHSRLKRIMGKPHPNIFETVDVIKSEKRERKLEQFAADATKPPWKKKYIRDEKIHKLFEHFQNVGETSLAKYSVRHQTEL